MQYRDKFERMRQSFDCLFIVSSLTPLPSLTLVIIQSITGSREKVAEFERNNDTSICP